MSLGNELAGAAEIHELLDDSITHDLRGLEVESFRHQISFCTLACPSSERRAHGRGTRLAKTLKPLAFRR